MSGAYTFECMSGGNVGLSDNARTNKSWYHDSNVIKSGHTFVWLVAMLDYVITHVQVSHVTEMIESVHTRWHTSIRDSMRMCCNALQHTATHCNTLHHTAHKKKSWHRNDWVNSHVWISHTCEFDMSQVWMSRVTRMYESYYRNDWVNSNVWQWLILTCVIIFSCNIITKKKKMYERCHKKSVILQKWLSQFTCVSEPHVGKWHGTGVNESCLTYVWVMTHIRLSHVTHAIELWKWHGTGVNVSCLTYVWVMTHIRLSHVTYAIEHFPHEHNMHMDAAHHAYEVYYSVLQCVAVCCSVLQCVAVCCSVLQCVTACVVVMSYTCTHITRMQCVTVCCSVLQCVAVCCIVL